MPEELEPADLILITHHDKDNCKHIAVKRLSDQHTTVIAPEICMKELGTGLKVIKAGDIFQIDNITIEAVPAYNTHKGNSTKKIHHVGQGLGCVIEIYNNRIYHAGDTDLITDMQK